MKAVVLLAFALACSSSSAATHEIGDAGEYGPRRGYMLEGDARRADAIRAVDAVVVPVAVDAQSGDLARLQDVAPSVVSDARPVVDAVAPDLLVSYRDDAGKLHCSSEYRDAVTVTGARKADAGAVNCGGYWGVDGKSVSCWRDVSGLLAAPCRLGAQGADSWEWFVLECGQCAGLEKWDAVPFGGAS